MAQVAININGRNYQIACDDGQEDHLRQLADFVDRRVGELVAAMGQVGDTQLLVMASLLVADELADSYGELDRAQSGTGEAAGPDHDALADSVERLAAGIEDVAGRLERA